MRYHLLIVCFLSTFLFFSQEEKRLALVIGNSNYDKGELKNPVNDANLIAKKLDSLNFDVILATDIENKRSMINKIGEFGDRREDYDVGFVYYAGHGVQIGGENYLLPTKEIFEKETDVEDWGVSVQKIVRYLTSNTNQVNILVLDACRDNPFESTWNSTRSLKGDGLARMQVSGTLIAFSTDAGNTAADGDDSNSLYTLSLAKNMMLFDTSLDQVFRNVRREVLAVNPKQKPMEWSQLTGDEFFLRKSDLSEVLDEVEELINSDEEVFEFILEKIQQVLAKDKKNIRAYYLLAELYYNEGSDDQIILNTYDRIIKLNPKLAKPYYLKGEIYGFFMDDYDLALENYNKAIDVEPDNPQCYVQRGDFYREIGEFDKAIEDLSMAVKLDAKYIDPYGDDIYYLRGRVYIDKESYNEAIEDYKKSLELNTKSGTFNNLANAYDWIKEVDSALVYYDKAIALDSLYYLPYRNKALIYEEQDKYDLAEAAYSKAIEKATDNASNSEIARSYFLRGDFYENYNEDYKAIDDYSIAIDLDPDNARYYFERAWVYGFELENKEFNKAIIDFTRSNDLEPDSANMNNIGTMLRDNTDQYNKAIYYYDLSIAMDSLSYYGYRNKGLTYVKMGDYDKAFENYSKALELDSTVVYNYELRAQAYAKKGELNKAVDDYTKIIELVSADKESLSDALDNRGDLYATLGVYDKAINDFKKSLDLYPKYYPTYNRLGDQHYNIKEIDSSITYYNKAIEIEDNYYSHLKKAVIYQNLNLFEDSLAEFYKFIEFYPDDANSYFYLINLFISFDKFDKAIEVSKKLIELSPEDPDVYYKRSLIYEKQGEYVKAILDSNMSIARLGLGDYYVGAIDNSEIRLGLADLYKHRISLYQKRNMNDFVCEDLNALRELIIKENLEESDMIFKLTELEKFAQMSVSEIENCRN